ncbi:hypothetical protein AB0K04_02960 [Micromonospora coxensis]|uniref:hypothetical protein n=1 Tax=Micromonospora coxensis TaxID=356852 RepID=UPI00342D78E9
MTSRLTEALRGIAAEAVPPVVPEDLFDRARARHRHRRAAAAGALAVLVLLVGVGYVVRPTAEVRPAAPASARTGLPDRLAVPPLRTASVGLSAPGRAAAVLGGPALRTDWFEWRLAVVAAETDRYRTLEVVGAAGYEVLLSPDGRYLWTNDELIDLTTGRPVGARPDGYPLAFAPDGERLVYAAPDDFTAPNTYTTPWVGLYDRTSHRDVLRLRIGVASVGRGNVAAVSPQGDRLAVQVGDEVWLTRTADVGPDGFAAPYRKLPLAGGRLAGPGAWLPDGRLALLEQGSCVDCPVPGYRRSWRLTLHGPDGRQSTAGFPQLRSAVSVQVVGWRSAEEAVALVGSPGDRATDVPDEHGASATSGLRLVVLRQGATGPEEIFRTPAGVNELSVAADLAVAGAVREAGTPDLGPPPSWLIALGLIAAALLAAVVVTVRLLWRHRRSPRRGRVDPAAENPADDGDRPGDGAG